ncbi:MAG: SHOCT domain-containing protein [bacterium]|nr:SHOCT domain-containing protein [bacterium]
MLLFWALIIWAIIAIARYFSGKGGMCGGQDHGTQEKDTTPLDILKERYAKGEIDKKEFEAMKKEVS